LGTKAILALINVLAKLLGFESLGFSPFINSRSKDADRSDQKK